MRLTLYHEDTRRLFHSVHPNFDPASDGHDDARVGIPLSILQRHTNMDHDGRYSMHQAHIPGRSSAESDLDLRFETLPPTHNASFYRKKVYEYSSKWET
ncbi:hypothetical protein AVEN_25479-1 [Araneus ventricosus]|uniref:Uncharacterized protein n=1 Tax=Araneus ventricosus TaxID=182803 RepID=A0A4Y2CRZ0_ARAVE|nr:hypothetical protein AVEN_25479-1 [Araneus ventricosus]